MCIRLGVSCLRFIRQCLSRTTSTIDEKVSSSNLMKNSSSLESKMTSILRCTDNESIQTFDRSGSLSSSGRPSTRKLCNITNQPTHTAPNFQSVLKVMKERMAHSMTAIEQVNDSAILKKKNSNVCLAAHKL